MPFAQQGVNSVKSIVANHDTKQSSPGIPKHAKNSLNIPMSWKDQDMKCLRRRERKKVAFLAEIGLKCPRKEVVIPCLALHSNNPHLHNP